MATQTLKRTRAKFVSKQTVEQVGEFLQELPEKTSDNHSLRQAVEQLRETLEAALAKGYTYEDLVPILAQQGIEIQPSTLKRYILTSGERSTAKRSASGKTKSSKTRKQSALSAAASEPTSISGKKKAKAGAGDPVPSRQSRAAAKVTPEPTAVEATEAPSKPSKQTRSRQASTASSASTKAKSRTTATRGRKTTKA